MVRKSFLAFLAGILVCSLSEVVSATPLSPGQNLSLAGSTAPKGTVIAQSDTPFDAGLDGHVFFTADLRSSVIRESGGTLDFYYQVANNNSYHIQSVQSIAISGFACVSTDADFVTASNMQDAPTGANRSSTGDVIQWTSFPYTYGEFFPPAATTNTLVIKTNATAYSASGAAVAIQFIDTQDIAGVPPTNAFGVLSSFAPNLSGAVPEPATTSLAAIGAILLAVHRKLRRC